MKLIRRKPKPTPAEQALGVVSKVVRGLAAVRVARSAYGTYKFARRLPLVLGGLGVVAGAVLLSRKLRGGGDAPQTETWSPASAPAPAPAARRPRRPRPPAPRPPVDGDHAGQRRARTRRADTPDTAVVPELEPNPAETAGTGSPEPELIEDEPATPPTVSAIADETVADAPGASAEADTEDAAKS
jgi:hypothetical protein